MAASQTDEHLVFIHEMCQEAKKAAMEKQNKTTNQAMNNALKQIQNKKVAVTMYLEKAKRGKEQVAEKSDDPLLDLSVSA